MLKKEFIIVNILEMIINNKLQYSHQSTKIKNSIKIAYKIISNNITNINKLINKK
jgi:hypothetical protein